MSFLGAFMQEIFSLKRLKLRKIFIYLILLLGLVSSAELKAENLKIQEQELKKKVSKKKLKKKVPKKKLKKKKLKKKVPKKKLKKKVKKHDLSMAFLSLQQKESPFFQKTNLYGVEALLSYNFWRKISLNIHFTYAGGLAKTDQLVQAGEYDMYLLQTDFSISYKFSNASGHFFVEPYLGGGYSSLSNEAKISSLSEIETGEILLTYDSNFIFLGTNIAHKLANNIDFLFNIKALNFFSREFSKEMSFKSPSGLSGKKNILEVKKYKTKPSFSLEPKIIWWIKSNKSLGVLFSFFYLKREYDSSEGSEKLGLNQLALKLGLEKRF